MNKETFPNNTNNNAGAWESLADLDVGVNNGYRTQGGVILLGKEAEAQQRKDLGIENKQAQESPIGTEVQEPASDVSTEIETREQEPTSKVPIETEIEAQELVLDDMVETGTEISRDNTEEDNSTEEDGDGKEVAFIQGTELAKKYKHDPEYFTYLVDAEHGFAVEKTQAVETYIEKMKSAEDSKEIWQAMRMGQDILSGNNWFNDDDKQRVKDFMASPIARKKELEYKIANAQKIIKKFDGDIQRSENEYEQLNSGNVVDKFLNRLKIKEASERVRSAQERRDNAQKDVERYRADLQVIERELENVA